MRQNALDQMYLHQVCRAYAIPYGTPGDDDDITLGNIPMFLGDLTASLITWSVVSERSARMG